MIIFKNLKNNQIKKQDIKSILHLKKQNWKYPLKSQYKYFYDNIKSNDIHCMMYLKKTLIGYTLLRLRDIFGKKFLLFDTYIVNKKFRSKGYGGELLIYDNKIIKKKKLPSILICKKSMVNFYKKYGWMLAKTEIGRKKLMYYNKKKKEQFLISKKYSKLIPF
jgi:predicted GNAT family N-acyltransferase